MTAVDDRRPTIRTSILWSVLFLSAYGLGVFLVLDQGVFSAARPVADGVDLTAVDDVSDESDRTLIKAGSQVSDALLERGERDGFTVCTSTTDFVTVRMERVTAATSSDFLDPFLEIFTATGEPVAVDDDSAGDLNSQIVLDPTDEISCYLVVARAYEDESVGAYTITVETGAPEMVLEPELAEIQPQVPARPDVANRTSTVLAVPDARLATIDEPGVIDSYEVCGSPTDSVTFTMERPAGVAAGNLDPYLELFMDDGALLSSDNDSGGGRNARIVIDPTPDCFVIVASDQLADATGKYVISARLGEQPLTAPEPDGVDVESLYGEPLDELLDRARELDVPQVVRAEIAQPDEVGPYRICGSTDETITIEMNRRSPSTPDDFDPLLTLHSERDELIAFDDDSGETGDSRLLVPLEDDCYLLIASDAYRQSTGSYEIVVTAG